MRVLRPSLEDDCPSGCVAGGKTRPRRSAIFEKSEVMRSVPGYGGGAVVLWICDILPRYNTGTRHLR